MQELTGEQIISRTLIDLTIIQFFISFWRTNRPEVFFKEKIEQQKKDRPSTAHEVSEYISEHFCEHISLKKLAAKFGVSESHLSRSFKSSVGVGIREYINTLRIRKAQELLENTQLSIAEIAESVGFDNASYFGQIFLAHLGISPSQYRKELVAGRNTKKQKDKRNMQ